jgi:hypothetical protein
MGALFAKDEEFLLLFRKKARGRERDVNVYIVGGKREQRRGTYTYRWRG